MKNTKRRLEVFSFYNHTGIAAHLEKMALKGWLIQRITNFSWIYRRIEPKKIRFAVSYYPKASEFDPEPSEDQKAFQEFCAHTGWKLACTAAQMQIFYNEEENPTPIETEPTLELESIHASVKKSFLLPYGMLTLVGLLQGILLVTGLLGNPIAVLANPAQLFSGFCWMSVILICGVEMICYFTWYHRATKAAQHGEFLNTPDTSVFQRIMLLLVLVYGAYWLVGFIVAGNKMQRWVGIFMCIYMPALILLVNAVKSFLKRRKASRGVNRTVTMLTSFVLAFAMMGIMTGVTLWGSSHGLFAEDDEETYEHGGMIWIVNHDELPLTVEDLMDVDYDGYATERQGTQSIFLGNFKMTQYPRYTEENFAEIPCLQYRIVAVKVPAFYNTCKNRLIFEKESLTAGVPMRYEPQDAADWGANEVYRLYDPEFNLFRDTYLLCYDRTLVEIQFDWEPTPEQMQLVGERLGKF